MSINSLKYCEQKGLNASQITKQTYMTLLIDCIFNENFLRVLLLHIFCCILGLVASDGFFAMDIFSIINLSSTFKYLAKSISSHGQQLMFTFYIVIIFIYVFSVFAVLYFKSNFDEDSELCTTLIHCFWTIFNQGFTNGSGIVAVMNPVNFSEGNQRYFGYILIDILFFVCINCIMLNIVFGIIVDTFGELREESEKFGSFFFTFLYKSKKFSFFYQFLTFFYNLKNFNFFINLEEDSENYCFVCQISKLQYEKSGKVFSRHTSKEHNIWNYANFVVYINNKTEKDCNGLESKIFKKIQKGDISWVPFYQGD